VKQFDPRGTNRKENMTAIDAAIEELAAEIAVRQDALSALHKYKQALDGPCSIFASRGRLKQTVPRERHGAQHLTLADVKNTK
jgi:hypothetical protein